MSVRYIGTNLEFQSKVESVLFEKMPASEAARSGKFRNHDFYNRRRFPLTAALLDCYNAPYSRRMVGFYERALLRVASTGKVELSLEDKEVVL